ncbi:MAG: glycosyltransferase family 2 protein [Thermodesulfobacteriota bacterium]
MSSIAVVAVGYNRDKSLLRLLKSLSTADYDNEKVPLIISLDKSDNQRVVDIANDYHWPFGEKIIKIQAERIGLRNHIIACGNLSFEYGSVAVLEDDLIVSPSFYLYAKNAICKYATVDQIAGISLYSHLWNVNCSRPFIPADDGTDAYFLQFAQSWGQVWSETMWQGFVEWYKTNSGKIYPEPDLPERVTSWPDTSWLKYFNRYIVKTNRYFVYPKISLTTNFGDRGEHVSEYSSSFQVPLLIGVKKKYTFPDCNSDSICYDVFFERVGVGKEVGLPEKDICMDLYATKGNRQGATFWITMEKMNYKIHSSFGLRMRPHEENIFFQIEGNDIFCYDTGRRCVNHFRGQVESNAINIIKYDIRDIKRKFIWVYSVYLFKMAAVRFLKRFRKKLMKLNRSENQRT